MGRTGQTLRRRTTEAMAQRATGAGQSAGTGVGVGARLRYAFDNTMARGTPALVGWLFAVTLLLVVLFAVIDVALQLREGSIGFGDATFQALMHALDPGTVAGDTGSWRFKLTMLVLTIAGLFIVSALIGVIAAGIDARIAELRRGRSVVLEKDHTVILGWSDSVFTVISELAIANESRRRPVIAVLAPLDKVEVEDEIRAKVADLKGTRVVVRSGSPCDPGDLALVSPGTARSVVVLSPSGAGAGDSEHFDADREVIKTLLALRTSEVEGAGPRVVAQLRDSANLEVARLIGRDRPGRTSLVDIRETVAKLIVQTSRQSGAAAVYRELFDYDGDEIYFLREHALGAATYAQAQQHYEHVTVIGIADEAGATLNPPADLVIGDHALVVVAEDDSILATAPASGATVDTALFADAVAEEPRASHAVLIGWNERAPVVVAELDRYAAPGSTLTVLTAFGEPEWPALTNLEVTVVRASTTARAVLDAHVPPSADQVLVLCYSDHLDAEAADATTLITLLHVRDILATSASSTPVVSEMIDDRNRALAQVADIDDVVVSGEIVSLIVAQLSEDARIEPVLEDLLDSDGSEIYLRPAEWYVTPGRETAWATVVAAAARRGETAIGFASAGLAAPGSRVGVVVNPAKSEPLSVEPGDRVVVLAEL